jgi:hypothetical protein
MCRNIKTLFSFEPPATELEIRDASLQFVRKLSGFNVPSKANGAAFERAVEEVAASARRLIASLVTAAEPCNRDVEAERARARAAIRFGVDRRTRASTCWNHPVDADRWQLGACHSVQPGLRAAGLTRLQPFGSVACCHCPDAQKILI